MLLGSAALTGSTLTTHAFPIAPAGTEGLDVVASGPVAVTVVSTYEGNSAAYSNDLYLERLASGLPGLDGIPGNDLFLFNNHANSPGDTANLGNFASGTELVFRLHVNNTGDNFLSGNASRNPDSLAHARVQNDWTPGTTLVSFEDLLNEPEGVNGFNDLSFSFTNTRSSGGGGSVPDSGSTMAMFCLSLVGLGFAKRQCRRAGAAS